MATQSDGKSGTGTTGKGTGSRASTAAGARDKSDASKRRATSKPVIIDLDADAVSTSTPAAAAKTALEVKPSGAAASSAASSASRGEQTQTRAGATATRPADQAKAKATSERDRADPAKPAVSAKPSDPVKPAAPVDPVVPPAASVAAAAQSGGASPAGSSAFYLFAAGFIGALLALVLMFLASLTGLLSLPDGRADDQAASMAALQTRLSALETAAQNAPTADAGSAFDPAILLPLEEGLADLQTQLDSLAALASDAAPADSSAFLADEVAPLAERVNTLEATLQSTLSALEDAQPGAVVALEAAPDPALVARLDALAQAVDALESAPSAADPGDAITAQADARMDALDGLVADLGRDTATQFETLSTTLQALQGMVDTSLNEANTRIDAVDNAMQTLANAPVAQMPDRLARLGVALDALENARDSGGDVALPLQAAMAAASFDGALSSGFSPVADLDVEADMSNAALRARYDAAYDAMRSAVPASQGAGLLGALEDRARELVTIRAPEGAVLSADAGPLDQLDQMGRLISVGRHGDALDLANALPADMQAEGAMLIAQLNARVVLDEAVSSVRTALLHALSTPFEPAPISQ